MTPLKHKKTFRLIFFAVIAAIGLLLLLFLPNKGENSSPKSLEDQSNKSLEESPQESKSLPSPSSQETYTGPDVPKREPVDDNFFSDAAFMGNSLMEGFKTFSELDVCDYYTATSMNVVAATSKKCVALDNGTSGTMVEGLTQKPYGKIYILLGINEIGYNIDSFSQMYSEMLDTIIAAQPDCDIYIMSLTPVSQEKSKSSEIYNMEHITTFNEKLYSIAKEKQCYYLDLVSALSEEDGYLPASQTSDGVHFSSGMYSKWLDYLKTHYIESEIEK